MSELSASNHACSLNSNELLIDLGQAFYALIDKEDFDRIKHFKWRVEMNRGRYPVVTARQTTAGKRRTLNLAKLIAPPPPGQKTLLWHRPSGNERIFDFRKQNLFHGSSKEQNQRRQKTKARTSSYKGVSFDSRRAGWVARIRIDGHPIRLGIFPTDTEAARAYNAAAQKYFGAFAKLNDVG